MSRATDGSLGAADSAPGSCSRRGRALAWIACAVAAALFTLVMVQHAMRHGRLLLPPSYDDVTYFLDGLERLDRLHNDGLRGLIAMHTADPPHSPFSTYLAMGAFAVAGPREWAPYAANGLLILLLLLALRKLWPEASARVRICLAALPCRASFRLRFFMARCGCFSFR